MSEQIQPNDPVKPANQAKPMGEYMGHHHDKLLLAGLFVFSMACVLVLVRWNVDAQIMTFATGTVTALVGAIVALVTGRRK